MARCEELCLREPPWLKFEDEAGGRRKGGSKLPHYKGEGIVARVAW
jgi:hypothetical protein